MEKGAVLLHSWILAAAESVEQNSIGKSRLLHRSEPRAKISLRPCDAWVSRIVQFRRTRNGPSAGLKAVENAEAGHSIEQFFHSAFRRTIQEDILSRSFNKEWTLFLSVLRTTCLQLACHYHLPLLWARESFSSGNIENKPKRSYLILNV